MTSMDYTTLVEQIEPLTTLEESDTHSLYAAFQQITDGRCKRGVRYPLALLLTLIVLANLIGEVTMSGGVDWVRLRHTWLNYALGLTRMSWPCFSTYTYALGKLDLHTCTQIISSALTRLETMRRCAEEPSRLLLQEGASHTSHVAFDGKALRGTNGHEAVDQPSVHRCAFYEVATGNVLAQREVCKKEGEISADAMHTQRFFCQTVTQYGGKYLLIAKDNQPTMRKDLELFFEDPDAERTTWETFTSLEKGHGRLEKRTVTTSVDLRDWFAKEWSAIEQVFRVERTVTRRGQTSHEIVYGITSLSPQEANAAKIAEFVRGHWAI
ncbi:MAG: ISAs1 family transposase [Ktedonobacteraceae bacterium]